jgi:hypothetical protein
MLRKGQGSEAVIALDWFALGIFALWAIAIVASFMSRDE